MNNFFEAYDPWLLVVSSIRGCEMVTVWYGTTPIHYLLVMDGHITTRRFQIVTEG